jgi:hypothetical protein
MALASADTDDGSCAVSLTVPVDGNAHDISTALRSVRHGLEQRPMLACKCGRVERLRRDVADGDHGRFVGLARRHLSNVAEDRLRRAVART